MNPQSDKDLASSGGSESPPADEFLSEQESSYVPERRSPTEANYTDHGSNCPPDSEIESTDVDRTIIKSGPFPTRPERKRAVLIVLNGDEIGGQFPLRRQFCRIGRTTSAEVAIKSDSLISRFHAQIEQVFDPETRETSYVLTDLDSTNHTFVNGSPVARALLSNGDQIQTGETIIRFALLDEMEAHFHKEIHDRLRFDTLTGLLTKSSFDLAADSELSRCQKRKLPLSVLMMDIDFFRRVNDGYGHQGGSWILSQLGRLLEDNLRGFDIVGRFGGEEFVAALPETAPAHALEIAERIRTRLEERVFVWNQNKIRITISIGVSHHPDHGQDIRSLIGTADEALYVCKHTGRNKVTEANSDAPEDFVAQPDAA